MPTRLASLLRSQMRRRPWLVLLAVNLIGLLALALLFEIALRLFPPAWLEYRMARLAVTGNFTGEVGNDRRPVITNRLGIVVGYEPGDRFSITHDEFQHEVAIDELGGRVVVPRVEEGAEMLPFFGDSFTFGVGVSDAECFASRLQPEFAARIVNLGLPGTGLGEQLLQLETHHENLGSPSVVVFFVCLANDLENARRRPRTQRISRERQEIKRRRSQWLIRIQAWMERLNDAAVNGFLRHSHAVQYVRKAGLTWLNRRSGRNYLDSQIKGMLAENEPRHRQDFAFHLDRLEAAQKERGFRSVFVLLPYKYQVDPEQRRWLGEYYGIPENRLDPLLPNRIVSEELKARGFPFLDAIGSINPADAARSFYLCDHHMTVLGHEAVARTIADPLARLISEAKRN